LGSQRVFWRQLDGWVAERRPRQAIHRVSGQSVLVLEPPRTRYDLRFSLAGFPVRIHPAFWLIAAILGLDTERFDLVELLLWVLVILVSILVHELGHALAVRRCGWVSRIILYHLGGLATIEPPRDPLFGEEEELSTKAKVLIAAAGPAAGFLLAGVVIAGLSLAPINFQVIPDEKLGLWFTHDYDRLYQAATVARPKADADGPETDGSEASGPEARARSIEDAAAEDARHRRIATLIRAVLFVNIFWGLVNLLPVFPLDGGQIARELLCRHDVRAGTEKALLLSTIVAAIVAAAGLLHFGFVRQGIFLALMFGLLAFINYRVLQQIRAMGGPGGPEDYGGYEPEDWWKR
jgi:Zn-dependent protease